MRALNYYAAITSESKALYSMEQNPWKFLWIFKDSYNEMNVNVWKVELIDRSLFSG